MKIVAKVMCGILFGFVFVAPCISGSEAPTLSVVGKIVLDRGPFLELGVTNNAAAVVQVFAAQLPWVGPSRVTLAITPEGGDALRRVAIPEGYPVPQVVSLRPGETIRGRINLSTQIVGIEKALSRGRLIVFWHYVARNTKRVELGEFGGWAAIERHDANPSGH